jgi:hypothetical protein
MSVADVQDSRWEVAMPTYTSRHNPRKHLIVLGERVASSETYDRYYDVGWEAFQRGVLPLLRLEEGRLVFRYSNATIEQSRTVREPSSARTRAMFGTAASAWPAWRARARFTWLRWAASCASTCTTRAAASPG